MLKKILIVIIFITLFTKSCYTIPQLDQDEEPRSSDVKTTISNPKSKTNNVPGKLSLSSLYYDQVNRRFYFQKKQTEGRNMREDTNESQGFFNEFFNLIRKYIIVPFFNNIKEKNKKQPSKIKIKSPSKNDNDPISNFLDSLDDMFHKSFDYSSSESVEHSSSSDSSIDYDSTEIVTLKTKKQQNINNNFQSDSSESVEAVLEPPNKKVTKIVQKIEDRHKMTTEKTIIVSSSSNIINQETTTLLIKTKSSTKPSTGEKIIKNTEKYTITQNGDDSLKRNKNHSSQFYQTTMSNSQFIENKKSTRKVSKLDKPKSTTEHPIKRDSNLSIKNGKECNDKKPAWMLPNNIKKPSVATTTQSTSWFNFLSEIDNEDETTEPTEVPTNWFSNLFDDDDKPIKSPTNNTENSPISQSDWFNDFLNVEEDDGAYTNNTNDKHKKDRRKHYKGYQLLRIYPNTGQKVKDLQELEDYVGSGIMWWSIPALNKSADLLVPSNMLSDIKEYLNEEDLKHEIIIWNLQNAIMFENPKLSKKQRLELEAHRGHPLTWRRYHRYADILRYMEYLSIKYPEKIDLIPLGRSSEGLPLIAAKISIPDNRNVSNKKKWKLKSRSKPAVWIDGGLHAREWISPAVVTWILHTLVEGVHGNGAEIEMLRLADWYILPVANPDGYEFSHTKDRLWQKTRSKNTGTFFNSWFPWEWTNKKCIGVDLNRNWDFHWGETGASEDPCSDYYAGPAPFSEPESKAISQFIMNNNEQMKVFLTLHAYSQMWLIPTTHSKVQYSDKNELMEMGKLALNALKEISGTKYDISTLSDLLQQTSGTAHDWAKGRAGIKYAYAINLKGSNGPFGYLMPGSQIIPTAKEIWEAIKAIVDNL